MIVCRACKLPKPARLSSNSPGYDPCLGRLEGVQFACCGHGVRKQCYLVIEGRQTELRREEALSRMIRLGGDPAPFDIFDDYAPGWVTHT